MVICSAGLFPLVGSAIVIKATVRPTGIRGPSCSALAVVVSSTSSAAFIAGEDSSSTVQCGGED
eukprot:scaffold7419_cov137-Isochrysis_galbana.AAC.6